MKTIAICNHYILNLLPDSIIINHELCGEDICFGLLDIPYPDFSKYFKTNSVLIKIKAFSCNYRDKSLVLQFANLCKEKTNSRKYFYAPFGSDFVAEVLKVGNEVTKFKPGDRVIPDCSYPFRTDGTRGGIPSNYASQRIQLLKSNQLIKIPDSMPDDKAAAFSIASQTVYSMIRKISLQKNENILLTAATSNTSLAAINALKHKEVCMLALSTSTHFEEKLKSLGIQTFIPGNAINDRTISNYIDNKLDVIVDPFFDIYYPQINHYLTLGGRYIYCGIFNQHPSFVQQDKTSELLNFDQLAGQSIMNNITTIANCLGEKQDLEKAITDYQDGKYNVSIDTVFTGENFIHFIEKSFGEKPKFGKVVYKYED